MVLVTAAVLDRAKAMLTQFDAIGLAEHFSTSLGNLERLTGLAWTRHADLRDNASTVAFEQDCELDDIAMEFVWADIELYDAAQRRFP